MCAIAAKAYAHSTKPRISITSELSRMIAETEGMEGQGGGKLMGKVLCKLLKSCFPTLETKPFGFLGVLQSLPHFFKLLSATIQSANLFFFSPNEN